MLVINCSICGCEFVYENEAEGSSSQKPAVIKLFGGEQEGVEDSGKNIQNSEAFTKTLIYLKCPNGHMRPYWAHIDEKENTEKSGPFGLFKKKLIVKYVSDIKSIAPAETSIDNSKADSVNMIDDYFWLDDMRSCLKDVWTLQRESADKLSTFVTWLWTGYTSMFGISAFLFSDKIGGAPLYLFAFMIAPIVLLPFAYYFCVRARMPHEATIIDYRIPESIEESNMNLLFMKSKSFRHASAATFLSIITFIAALLSFIYYQTTQNSLEAFIGEGKKEIIITGRIQSGSSLSIIVESWEDNRTGRIDTSLSNINTGNGAFNLYFPFKDSSGEYTVLAFWKNKNNEMSYAKRLKR